MSPSAPTAAIATALIAAAVALAKKFLPRKQTPKPEYITRAELHAGLDAIRSGRVISLPLAARSKLPRWACENVAFRQDDILAIHTLSHIVPSQTMSRSLRKHAVHPNRAPVR